MQKVNPDLMTALEKKLGISKSQVYRRIGKKVTETHLDRHLAAIIVASDSGLNVAKYAKSEELAIIRGLRSTSQQIIVSPKPQSEKMNPQAVPPLRIDLGFVSDPALRKILNRDIKELNAALSNGYSETAKTCMVLSGSITEALLLDVLAQDSKSAYAVAANLPDRYPTDLEKWGLYQMVTVAMNMTPPLLPADAESIANQLRRWRNLIHPGRELRESRGSRISPTVGRARASVSFLQFVAEELGK